MGVILGYILFLWIPLVLLWLLYRAICWIINIPKQRNAMEQIADQERMAALDELENNNVDRLLWAKAIEQSNGNEAMAKSIYIRLRAKKVEPQRKIEKNHDDGKTEISPVDAFIHQNKELEHETKKSEVYNPPPKKFCLPGLDEENTGLRIMHIIWYILMAVSLGVGFVMTAITHGC